MKPKLSFLAPIKPFINKPPISPCSPKSLHQSWHQLITFRSLWPIKIRSHYSPDVFASSSADRHEVEKILAIYSQALFAPSHLTNDNIIELMQYRDKYKLKSLKYLYLKDVRNLRQQFKKYHQPPLLHSKSFPPGQLCDPVTKKPCYGIHNVNLIRDLKIPKFYNIYESAIFGTKLVIDLSYDHLMRPLEQCSLANQVARLFYENQTQLEPFDLALTNFSNNRFFVDRFREISGGLSPSEHFFDVHEKQIFEVFPKDKLIYLSPDAEDDLTTVDPEKIYVIGGLVDTFQTSNNASYEYCKKHEIKMAKLPLNSLPVNVYSIRLSLFTVYEILNDIKLGFNATSAVMNHLPLRKTRNVKYREIGKNSFYLKELKDPLHNLFKRMSSRRPIPIEKIVQCSREECHNQI